MIFFMRRLRRFFSLKSYTLKLPHNCLGVVKEAPTFFRMVINPLQCAPIKYFKHPIFCVFAMWYSKGEIYAQKSSIEESEPRNMLIVKLNQVTFGPTMARPSKDNDFQ